MVNAADLKSAAAKAACGFKPRPRHCGIVEDLEADQFGGSSSVRSGWRVFHSLMMSYHSRWFDISSRPVAPPIATVSMPAVNSGLLVADWQIGLTGMSKPGGTLGVM